MPQEIRIVKCFECEMFQVDIVKKVNKWQCKLCGIKQSFRQEFFRGTGAECRIKAQELNMQKDDENFDWDAVQQLVQESSATADKIAYKTDKESKWSKYSDESAPTVQTKREATRIEEPGSSSNIKQKYALNANCNQVRPTASGVKRKSTNENTSTESSKWGAFV